MESDFNNSDKIYEKDVLLYLDNIQNKKIDVNVENLCQLFEHNSYLVKSKSFVTLKKLDNKKIDANNRKIILDKILDIFMNNEEEEYRLRALESIQYFGDETVIESLTNFWRDKNPCIIRGIFVALGFIGGKKATKSLLEFAASPYGRVIRLEIIEECVAYGLSKIDDSKKFLDDLAASNGDIKRLLVGLTFKVSPIAKFSVYPCNDYFALLVKKRGMNYGEYKRIIGS